MTIDEELTPPTIFNSGEKRKQYEDMELGSISLFKARGIIYIFNKIIVNKSRIQKSLFLSWKIWRKRVKVLEGRFMECTQSLRQIFKYRMSKTFSPGHPKLKKKRKNRLHKARLHKSLVSPPVCATTVLLSDKILWRTLK